ncbi:Cytosine-specific methyltransferase [Candidatus Xenohaliotis californiensis]|uniref:Cytosine-specific methyltransferase n=1 Tax=Candidatus Xenohaliotis californiensis TaxID=84677 RepID=A0ABM9N8C5_9RICK|nr:Cytosine-specific methyltransferase [Candidatus Xenohaliotis californiensis]
MQKPEVISLFSGCGGLDLGFHLSGFKIVYANDIAKAVQKTYEYNLGQIEICDIKYVKKEALPNCDIVLAGIPCQPFSNAGKRESTSGKHGNLFQEVIQTVEIKQPKILLLENVRGFLSARDENKLLMPLRMKLELKKIGYKFFYKLLNSSDYNVPQNRYRVFIIGIRNDIHKDFTFPYPNPNKLKLTIDHILSMPKPQDEEDEVWQLPPQSANLIKHIPEGGSWRDVSYELLPARMQKIRDDPKNKNNSSAFYRRFARKEIMGTITSRATPERSGITHSTLHRRYSVREIARFQSFPDSFKFIGTSVVQKYKMIGNAVPVKLAECIAKKIMVDFFS